MLSGRAHYLHWGVVQISLTNLVIVALMLVLFVAALVVPFPHGRHEHDEPERDDDNY